MFGNNDKSTTESIADKVDDFANSEEATQELKDIASEVLANLKAVEQDGSRDFDSYAIAALERLENVPQHRGVSYSEVKRPLFEACDQLKKSRSVEMSEVNADEAIEKHR